MARRGQRRKPPPLLGTLRWLARQPDQQGTARALARYYRCSRVLWAKITLEGLRLRGLARAACHRHRGRQGHQYYLSVYRLTERGRQAIDPCSPLRLLQTVRRAFGIPDRLPPIPYPRSGKKRL